MVVLPAPMLFASMDEKKKKDKCKEKKQNLSIEMEEKK